MRLLHCSDLHLGKTLMERPLLEDQRDVLTQIAALLAGESFDLLVVAGDIFDRSIPPEDAVTLLGAWLAALREVAPALPILLIAGNHDSGARLAWSSGLLARANVHIRGDAAGIGEPLRLRCDSGEDAEVWALPFLWPGSLPTRDEHGPGQAGQMAAALDAVRAARRAGPLQVLVAHCFTQGGRISDSERTLVGSAALVEPGIFDGFDYAALGHLHRPQRVGPRCAYSGSPLGYSFSEAGEEKSVLAVELHSGAEPALQRRALRAPRALSRIGGSLQALLEDPRFEPFCDDYLSVTLSEPVRVGQPMALLRQRFPHCLHLENPAAQAAGSAAPARPRTRTEPDISEDFDDFEAHIRGGPPPGPVREAFQALRAAAHRVSP